MRTLLFLGASVSQVPALEYARLRGHRTIAVDGDPNAPGLSVADEGHAIDFTDVARVTELARDRTVDGVLSISTDRGVAPCAAVARALGLPGIGNEVAEAMTEKSIMRARLAEHGIRQPAYAVVRSADDVASALERVGTPAVLKPVDSGGQRGVFRVDSVAEAQRRLPETLALSRRSAAIVEAFVEGVELNVLLALRDGEPTLLTVSDRLRPDGLGFGVGWIHSYPSSLPEAVLDEVRDLAFASVRALGLRTGIAFPQLIASADGVHVVEVAARIAAGQMASLVRHATGIELYEVAIRQALGLEVEDALVTPTVQRPVVIRFLTAEPGVLPVGTITAIDGLDDVRRAPGVLEAGLYVGVGATLRPVQVDADRSGYVVATAATAPEALRLADDAAQRLVVQTA